MKTFREFCLCFMLVSFGALAIGSLGIERDMASEVAQTRVDVLDELQGWEGNANSRIADLIHQIGKTSDQANARTLDALRVVSATAGMANAQMAGIRGDLNSRLQPFSDLAAAVAKQDVPAIASALKPIGETAQQVADAAPYILDCDPSFAGADCLPNRYLEIADETDKTLFAISTAAPAVSASIDAAARSSASVAASADATGKEVVKAAKRFNAPQTPMQAFRSWALTIARIYAAVY